MATVIDICNIALSRISVPGIQSFNDKTKEATECVLHYPMARDALLKAHNWGFARRKSVLALLDVEDSQWAYVYSLPDDYLNVIRISNQYQTYYCDERYGVNDFSVDDARYEIASNEYGTKPVLYTNMAEVEIIYTARIEDSNAYDSLFINALAWRLARELSASLRGDLNLQQQMEAFYNRALGEAQTSNANEENNIRNHTSKYIKARK